MDIGTRMKSYEHDVRLTKGAVCIRVDGKSFHTWTKEVGLKRPFDTDMQMSMQYAMTETAQDMQAFKLAYTQSDECTFLLVNVKEKEEPWFDYKLQKLVSITASMFTHYFNSYLQSQRAAFFDARAFSIPLEDAANVFVWRQLDNSRNWLRSYAHSVFSHKELMNISTRELLIKLDAAGYKIAVSDWIKYGTFYHKTHGFIQEKLDYYDINELLGIDERIINAANQA